MTTINQPPTPEASPFATPPSGKQPKQPKQPKAAKEPSAKQVGIKSPTATAWPGPAKPSATLVPRYVRDRRAAQETLRVVVLAVAATLLLCIAAMGWSYVSAQSAQQAADEATVSQQAIQQEVDTLSSVALYYDGLVARQETAVNAMKNDLDTAALVSDIYEMADQNGVEVTSLAIPSPGSTCPGSNPFRATNSLGCVNLEVGYENIDDVAAFIDAVNAKTDLYNSAFANSFNPGESSSTAVTFNYSPALLSLAYVPEEQHDQVRDSYSVQIDPVTGQPIGATPTADPATSGAVPEQIVPAG